MIRRAILKAGKEKAIFHRHHWIFSGAIKSIPAFESGEILPVFSANDVLLGNAYFNKKSGIIGRMVSFGDQNPLLAIESRMDSAIQLRKELFDEQLTNGYRLINGEGDGIPGFIVDKYGDILVVQVGTWGIEKLKPFLIEKLVQKLRPKAIYEKSTLPARREEGLKDNVGGFIFGQHGDDVDFKENGLKYTLSLSKSQKTGFFLDQREMRQWLSELSKGKSILNAFSYSGGFTVAALYGGANRVDSVDISAEAMTWAKHNVKQNGFDVDESSFICADVFSFLRERDLENYQVVILDPPAFAKKQKDVVAACRGYKDINRIAMQKMPHGSILITCSCSHHVDETLFRQVLFQAAYEADREVKIIGTHRLAADHPINIFHPESEYLKSFVLFIN